MTIYTIGYQKLTPRFLKTLSDRLKATVFDCRFHPVTRKPGFGKRQLSELLGDKYEWHGSHLGGFNHTTKAGIDLLRREKRNVILLCMEHTPIDCHRHFAICAPHFPKALHIYEDEVILAGELDRAIREDTDYEIEMSISDLLN